jgi:hypothetical protein
MKRILLLCFLLPILISAEGQDLGDTSKEAISKDTAEYYYGNRQGQSPGAFTVKREKIAFKKVFQVKTAINENEVYNRALSFARLMSTNYKTSKGHAITVPITWNYKGGFNECIENLIMNGTMKLEFKGNKTRISISEITYQHFDDKNKASGVAKSDLFSRKPDCAPASGKVELLYNCTQCTQSLRSLDRGLETQFTNYAREYQERLKKY